MVAPFNGTIEKAQVRTEIAQDGSCTFRVLESTDGTEVPGTLTGRKDQTEDVADDTTITFDMTGVITSGTNALTKGRIYTFYLGLASVPNDTNVTLTFKWDITS